MDLQPIHSYGPSVQPRLLEQCVAILNHEWPRSDTIRLRSLTTSSPNLPTNLVLTQTFPDKGVFVVGHARISRIPKNPAAVFIESVVIHPDLRGKGLGKYLMLRCEQYCLGALGFTVAYLTTHDKQVFYSRVGYAFSESVCAYGGSSKLPQVNGITNTAKDDCSSQRNLPPVKKSSSQKSQAADLKCSISPSPPGPPAPPPPPPPVLKMPGVPPPPPLPKGISSPNKDLDAQIDELDAEIDALILKCEKVHIVPKMPEIDPVLSEPPAQLEKKGLSKKDDQPREELKMFMKKNLECL